jgi:hypothetical protein
MGEMRSAYSNFVGEPEGKRPLRWESNVKIVVMEMGWEDVDWFHLVQDRCWWWDLLNIVMNFGIP